MLKTHAKFQSKKKKVSLYLCVLRCFVFPCIKRGTVYSVPLADGTAQNAQTVPASNIPSSNTVITRHYIWWWTDPDELRYNTLKSVPNNSSEDVKQSHYRSGQALRVPGVWGSHISRQSAHEDGKVVSSTHRPPLPTQEIFLVLISVRGWRLSWLQGHSAAGRIMSVTTSGIEPATFQLAEQCLNQLRHRVALTLKLYIMYVMKIMSKSPSRRLLRLHGKLKPTYIGKMCVYS